VLTDEGAAEERRELASGGFKYLARSGGLDDLGEVGLDLQLGGVGGVDPGGPVDLFALGEDGARHLELAQLAGEREHPVGGLSLRHLIQAIAEREEGVERDQMLVFKYGTDSSSEFLMDALAIGGVLTRTCEEIDDLAGRTVRGVAGCDQKLAEGG